MKIIKISLDFKSFSGDSIYVQSPTKIGFKWQKTVKPHTFKISFSLNHF